MRAHVVPTVHTDPILARIVNPIVGALLLRPVRVVHGRRPGREIRVPFDGPFVWRGARYLVSPRGETHWVRNLRARGLGLIETRAGTEAFQAEEIGGEEAETIVTAYAERVGGWNRTLLRRHPGPADHPVFRIDPPIDLD
ncbi:MAG: hypothetical protein ACKOTZ_14100 [Chloroflexota bacterium]